MAFHPFRLYVLDSHIQDNYNLCDDASGHRLRRAGGGLWMASLRFTERGSESNEGNKN